MVLPHQLLGVEPDADLATIKRAFRALVKEWHPDRSRDPRASLRFQQVLGAYRSLARERSGHAPAWQAPPAPRSTAPAWTAARPIDTDLAWDAHRPGPTIAAYPARLSRLVLIGIGGAIALLWVSAFLSHL